jgi:hypothetical protein
MEVGVKQGKSKLQFVPKLYRRAPRLTKDGFVKHIHKFENDRGGNISHDRAKEIFDILRQQSHDAEEEGRRNDIWITFDEATGEWGGSETPSHRESYGMDRNTKRGEQSKGSHREKFGKISACSKQDFADEIMAIEGCGFDRATQIWRTCKDNGIAKHHKPTNTWRGFLADPPTLADAAKVAPTSRQEEYRKRYGCMPWLTNDWQNPEQSEVLGWIVERDAELGEEIDIEEAQKRYKRAWSCSKDKSKVAFVRDPKTKLVRGVDYRETSVFRQMPKMREDRTEFDTWLTEHVSSDFETAVDRFCDALKCGDLVELERDEDGVVTCVGADLEPVLRYRLNESTGEYDPYISSRKISEAVYSKLIRMPPLERSEAEAWLREAVGFDFDAARLMREEDPLFNFKDGKWVGVSYGETDEQDDDDQDDDGDCDEYEAENDSASGGYEDPEEKARRDKEAADRRAKIDEWIKGQRAADQAAKDAASKVAEAEERSEPTQPTQSAPEVVEAAQEPPKVSWKAVRATARPQHPGAYEIDPAAAAELHALWLQDVLRSQERDDDADIPTDDRS